LYRKCSAIVDEIAPGKKGHTSEVSQVTKERTLIDLRQYGRCQQPTGQESAGQQLIIDVLGQLVDHTEKLIGASIGEEKRNHQFRSTQFKKAISSVRAYRSIRSGGQARELPGIGKGIGDRIDEILETGTLSELAEASVINETTRIVNELTTVTGIGEANAKRSLRWVSLVLTICGRNMQREGLC